MSDPSISKTLNRLAMDITSSFFIVILPILWSLVFAASCCFAKEPAKALSTDRPARTIDREVSGLSLSESENLEQENFLRWDFQHVATLATINDPIIEILQRERVLWGVKTQRSGKDCRLESWMMSLLDRRVEHRKQELKADAWKLHFALAGLQVQWPVLSDLKAIHVQYREVAEKFKDAGLDAELLQSKLRELESHCQEKESLLAMQLQQLRVGLRSLLRHPDSEIYWPSESLDIRFQQVDRKQELQRAHSFRADINVWESFPQRSGDRDEITTLQQVLATAIPAVPLASLASSKGAIAVSLFHSQDLRRELGQRKLQVGSLAKLQQEQMEMDVALQVIKLQNSYALAQQSQEAKDAAERRLEGELRMADLGAAQLRLLLESQLEYQKHRSLTFQRFSEARQEEIGLALVTGDREPWKTYAWVAT
ncbi:MAG: hypothetical protein RLY14_1280, partial [Planctomycetota bacterium]